MWKIVETFSEIIYDQRELRQIRLSTQMCSSKGDDDPQVEVY